MSNCEEMPAKGEKAGDGLLDQLLRKVVELASWDCEVCGEKFNDRRVLHTRYHHLESGTCNVCYKPFPSRAKLVKHVQRKHTEPAIICTVCGKQFNDDSNFRRHVKKVCSVQKVKKPRKKEYFALQCDKCDKTYKHSRTLMVHQLEKHRSGQESAVAVASILAELLLNVKQQVEDGRGAQEERRALHGYEDLGAKCGYDTSDGADGGPKRWN